MTTATAVKPETTTPAEQSEKVDLTSNGAAPRRRGRPPGSKNKTAKAASATTPRVRRSAAPKATSSTVDITAQAVLIEGGNVNVLLADGTSFKINGPVFDRR